MFRLFSSGNKSRPAGLKWRSSSWFVTAVIGLGVAVDLLIYSIIIPVMPFHLEHLGYEDVSSLTGWLLFAFSGGLVVSTIPIAIFSERYNMRQSPLIVGLFILVGSQVMLMEAPNYPVMCIARILQGIGSSIVWVVGLALLCDSAPPSKVGVLLGCAMSGLSIGVSIGPPVGGALYSHFGYRGPFIFGIIATMIDLVGRLLVIERKDAIAWGVDPASDEIKSDDVDSEKMPVPSGELNQRNTQFVHEGNASDSADPSEKFPRTSSVGNSVLTTVNPTPKSLSFPKVIMKLGQSRRALCAIFITFVYGIVYTAQEPTIPVHMQAIWGLDSKKVGLVFIAAVVPTLFSSPATGYISDKYGAEWVTPFTLLLALPWWVILIIEKQLALFIAAFALESMFTAGVISPLTAEFAAVARDVEGIGYGHVYGAFNFIYGIGTCIGPIIGGQIYDNVKHGWMVLCLISTGLLFICVAVAVALTGNRPMLQRLLHKRQKSQVSTASE